LENRTKVFYAMGVYPDFDQRVVGWVNGLRTQARNGRHPPQEFVALDHVLHDMRLFKSRTESSCCASRRGLQPPRTSGPCALPGRVARNTR